MELRKAEAESITDLIKEWLLHDKHELECTFGKGTVNSTTFFQVAQRLRSKGLQNIQQEDRLTISTPNHVRFTIQGIGIIQQYCKDDTLVGKPFTAMIKDRAMADGDTIDIADYEIRIKSRREDDINRDSKEIQDLLAQWSSVQKGFRLMRRWSFEDPVSNIRYDLSIVRSTARDVRNPDVSKRGGFKWQRKFTDQNIGSAPYMYEVEVELQHIKNIVETPQEAQKRLIKGIGEVLRGIQKNSILIRKSKKNKVLESYKEITKTNEFLGCKSKTLVKENFTDFINEKIPNIRTSYNVTDKADGLRCLGYCDSTGEFYLIDMDMNIYRTGLSSISNRESIIDGEWVTQLSNDTPTNMFMAFDIYYAVDKENVSQLPFYKKDEQPSRYGALKNWVETFNKGDGPKKLLPNLTIHTTLQVSMKNFFFGKDNDIFKYTSRILDIYKIYHTDGLIFTPNNLPLPGYDEKNKTIQPGIAFPEQFKWKPAKDNTIDFLVRFEKDTDNTKLDRISISVKPTTNETIRYKTMTLYVGSSDPKAFNPRDIILNERISVNTKQYGKDKYRPVPFYPQEYPHSMASKCYAVIKTDNATQEEYVATEMNNEPIQDYSIVEMRYDGSMDPGWRWIPLRIRHDKTDKLLKGILGGTLNGKKPAENIWNSIHDPITESMIRSGNLDRPLTEITSTLTKIKERNHLTDKYWVERTGPVEDEDLVSGLRHYHNKFIKERILYKSTLLGGGKTLIDLGCGKGSDIKRWNKNNVSFVVGIDSASDNIINTNNGIYSRYLNISKEFQQKNIEMAPMVFVIGDSAGRLIDGKAAVDEENSDILRGVFGRYNPVSTLPPYVDRKLGGLLKDGADVLSCMFALHYFFQSKEKLDGILRNIRETLKVGGYFIGCCFDGDSVFDFLKDTPKGGTKTCVEQGLTLWTIRKDYDDSNGYLSPSEESIGLTINVNFISIGTSHDEYLVPFPYFVEKMKEIGCELLTEQQASEIGLKKSTDMFGNSYNTLTPNQQKDFVMTENTKKFSFLNRWFVFIKTKEVLPEEGMATLPSLKSVLSESLASTRKKSAKEEMPAYQLSNEEKEELMEEAISEVEDTPEVQIRPEELPVGLERTIPVGPSSASTEKTYTLNEVFKFHFNAPLDDTLKIKDPEAARYISPQTPFKIRDFDNPSIIYPSIEHFMAAMLYKYGTNKPELAQSLFSTEGKIHNRFLTDRLRVSEGMTKVIPYDKDHEMIENELALVKDAIRPATIKNTYKAIFTEANFTIQKDALLRKAITYRYENDERMRKILDATKKTKKYILYYTEGTSRSNANLGGIHKRTRVIEGANKLGKLYMDLVKMKI